MSSLSSTLDVPSATATADDVETVTAATTVYPCENTGNHPSNVSWKEGPQIKKTKKGPSTPSPPPYEAMESFVATSLAASPIDIFTIDMLKNIISFVGCDQYRFIAGANRSFQEAYLKVFSENKRTYFNASTEELARFCWSEIGPNHWNHQMALSESAAKHGSIPSLQYLRSVRCDWNARTCAAAAIIGDLDVIKWCRGNGCWWNEATCAAAAEGGHLKVLKWCRENDCPLDSSVCSAAARSGDLKILKWCRENDCPWDDDTCSSAAKGGHLEVLKWCRENGCLWDKDTCEYLAESGHLEVLKWCRERGCPWDEWTCTYAAANGRLEVLKWCRVNGCPWDERTFEAATRGHHWRVMQWCQENGCPMRRRRNKFRRHNSGIRRLYI